MNFLLEPIAIEGPGGFQIKGPILLVVPALLAIVCAFIASLVWLHRDAKSRGKSGLIAICFIILSGWPVSFLWWCWLRPSRGGNEKGSA